MPVTQLPTPPSRADSANFAARSDALFTALPAFVNEINALEIATNEQTAANEAASQAAALAAANARDAAIAAWSASTAPTEQLSAISQSLHSGPIGKAIVYDTSKDSDGGAWRKRTSHTSWYTEALGFIGKWLGQKTNLAAAWATSGAAAGDGYQNVADGKFYALTGTNTHSEIWRGNVREFPAVGAVVVDAANRITIYDLTQPTCPLWKSWTRSSITSIAARDGLILVGRGASIGQSIFDFMQAVEYAYNATQKVKGNSSFDSTAFTTGSGITTSVLASGGIVNATVNDCAITVLDGAPIDPATGLPVPTIAVATAGGVSVIKDDGTVVNSSQVNAAETVAFVGTDLFRGSVNEGAVRVYRDVSKLGAGFTGGFYNNSTVPSITSTAVTRLISSKALGSSFGVVAFKENPATPAKGMVDYITNTYNSGWLVGDIRGAWLADTTAETISGSGELVTNGTFADATGWTLGNGWTVSGGVASHSGGAGYLDLNNILVVGKTYTVGVTGTGTNLILASAASNITIASSGSDYYTFVAAQSNLRIYSNGTNTVDNVSCKLAEPDRCVKNKGLIVNGSLTKAAVASGAGLVAYSGFANSTNYLWQPYNPDLDFGTGDFCVVAWVDAGTLGSGQYIFGRGAVSNPTLALYHTTGGSIGFVCSATGAATSSVATLAAGINHLALVRVSGVIQLYLNGALAYSAANTANITNASAILIVGAAYDYTTAYLGKIALFRITATAPSADQIAHIYRTELPLFQANAQCTLAGTSAAVTTLAHDDVTDVLHAGTSWGRSSFKDLLRLDSEATAVGALTSLSAQGGVVVTGGTSGRVYMPAMLLRDELRRRSEARRALGKVPVFFDYTATASQTAFVVPKGYTVKALYKNGTLMRETTTGVYWTRSNDGFAETATLSVGASVSDWISIMAVRS